MVQFVRMHNDKGELVAINPDQVRYVRPSGTKVAVVFDDEHLLIVEGTVDAVAKELTP
jgi:DNA-binding LytR/AlgR family response regulator